jgi:hypothetical protein
MADLILMLMVFAGFATIISWLDVDPAVKPVIRKNPDSENAMTCDLMQSIVYAGWALSFACLAGGLGFASVRDGLAWALLLPMICLGVVVSATAIADISAADFLYAVTHLVAKK